jgi:hypothetical protein
MKKKETKNTLSGREIERKFLRWLHHYYISLAEARPLDETLSRKVDCINYLREN